VCGNGLNISTSNGKLIYQVGEECDKNRKCPSDETTTTTSFREPDDPTTTTSTTKDRTTTTSTTEEPTTTTTSTTILSGNCRFVFVPDTQSTTDRGLRYNYGGEVNTPFSSLLGTPTNIGGEDGVVYTVCSTNAPQWLIVSTNTTTAFPSGIFLLADGGVCFGNGECEYVPTTTTSTTVGDGGSGPITTTTTNGNNETTYCVSFDWLGSQVIPQSSGRAYADSTTVSQITEFYLYDVACGNGDFDALANALTTGYGLTVSRSNSTANFTLNSLTNNSQMNYWTLGVTYNSGTVTQAPEWLACHQPNTFCFTQPILS
jgi:hypothetical protein